jgi:hypothetical protein
VHTHERRTLMENARRRMHPKRLMDNIFLYSDEIRNSALAEKIDTRIFDCISALQERVSGRRPFELEEVENEIADDILQYLMKIKK